MLHRRKRNRIDSLIDSEGVEKFEQEEMMKVVFNYYVDLFTSSRLPISIEHFDGIEERVSDSMRASLL